MITMTNESEETFIYEPVSFVANNPNVNPDSPRHFKTKRRRNIGAPKLKRRPQSLIDFRAINQKKEEESFDKKRSKTLIERCRVVLQRTISMDGLVEADKSSLEEESPLNYSKPITSRFKVREMRKVNSGISDKQSGKPNLIRSTSDGGVYCSSGSKSCNGGTKTRNSDYTETCSLKNIVSYDDYYKFLEGKDVSDSFDSFKAKDSNSLDSFKAKSDSSTSSPNSSGFCDYTGTESDNLSSDCSSLVTSDSSFYGKHKCSQDIVFDQDKLAEEKLYSRSLKKNRRPQSISRNRNESSINGSESPSVSPSGSLPTIDDVFMIDDVTNNKFSSDHITKKNIVTTGTPCSKKNNKIKERGSSPNIKIESDRSNGKKHKRNRLPRPKSSENFTHENSSDIKNKEPHDDKIGIEKTVERLTISPINVKLSCPEGSTKNKIEKRKKYERETPLLSLPNIYDTTSAIGFPIVKQRNLYNAGRRVRIESVI